MPTLALVLVLASAVVHAGWNAVLKRQPDPEAAAVLLVGLAAGMSAILGAVTGELLPPAAAWGWIVASGAIEAVYFVALARALARLPLGTAYGLSRGGGQLVTWPVALALGETASPVALVGAGILAGGLVARVRLPADGRGLVWAVVCAAAIGAYPLTYKQALSAGAPAFGLFALSLGAALPLQLLALGGTARLREAGRGRATLLVGTAALCAASFLAYLGALSLAGAGRTSALRNLSIVFATALGVAQGERLDRRTALGAAMITVGAIAVGWG